MVDDPNTLLLHLNRPSVARIYDWLLDPESPNNYAIDRTFADDQLTKMPDLPFFGEWNLLEPGLTWAGLWNPKPDRAKEPWWTEDGRGGEPWWGEHPERIRYRAGVAENPLR